MDSIIQQAKVLNNSLPDMALRRNSIYYELVTYINNSLAFYVSQQYDYSSLFIMRAYNLLHKKSKTFTKDDIYIENSKDFLDTIKNYYINNDLLSEEGGAYLNRIINI